MANSEILSGAASVTLTGPSNKRERERKKKYCTECSALERGLPVATALNE